MNRPRLLIANRNHVDTWGGGFEPGDFISVTPTAITVVGKSFEANILAVRPCALRVAFHMDRGSAAEKYHDQTCADFQRIKAIAEGPQRPSLASGFCYCGPELLLYIQKTSNPVTFLMASRPSQVSYRQFLQSHSHRDAADDSLVVKFSSKRKSSVNIPEWFTPKLEGTDLSWNRKLRYQADIDAFLAEAAAPGESEWAVKQRIIKDMNRLSGRSRRQFLNLIEQANDGDYDLDPSYFDNDPFANT